MVNGLKKVSAGQSMGGGFPAATYNAMIDVINAYRQGRLTGGNQNKGAVRSAGVVLIQNATGSNLARGNVVGIDSPVIGPEVDAAGPYWQQVALTGIVPTASHVPDLFAVAREAIPAGKIGYATLSGACQTQVYMSDAVHSCAGCVAGNSTYLTSRMNGGARILWVASTAAGVQNAIVRLADAPEVGMVRVQGTSGEDQDPYYGSYFHGDLMQYGVGSSAESVWLLPINPLDSVDKLRGQDTFIGMRAGPYTIGPYTREVYYIRSTEAGKVRVKSSDGLDYLEDQFADHLASPTYTEGHLLVETQTETDVDDDSTIRAFIQATGYDGNSEQALTHDEDSDSLVWQDIVEVDVITNLRISSDRIEKQVSTIKVVSNVDQGWQTALLGTACPEP